MGPYAHRKDAELDAKSYRENSRNKVTTEIIKITPLKNPRRSNPAWITRTWHMREHPSVVQKYRNLVDRLRFDWGMNYAGIREYLDHATHSLKDRSQDWSAAEYDNFMQVLDERPMQNPPHGSETEDPTVDVGFELEVEGPNLHDAQELAEKLREGIKTSSDICEITPSVCVGNLGIPRSDMPQFDDPTQTFLKSLQKDRGIEVQNTTVPVGQLKATQREINAQKVFGMLDSLNAGKFPAIRDHIIVSNDNFILDGHHRWATLLVADPANEMKVHKVDMPIYQLLIAANASPGVTNKGFSDLKRNPWKQDRKGSYFSYQGDNGEAVNEAWENHFDYDEDRWMYDESGLVDDALDHLAARGSYGSPVRVKIEPTQGSIALVLGALQKSKGEKIRVKTIMDRTGLNNRMVASILEKTMGLDIEGSKGENRGFIRRRLIKVGRNLRAPKGG
tara:strand:- start:228 stop:1571 length:1344 start_codon:yes stop_codon:yes gene_type:complete